MTEIADTAPSASPSVSVTLNVDEFDFLLESALRGKHYSLIGKLHAAMREAADAATKKREKATNPKRPRKPRAPKNAVVPASVV